MTPPTNSKLCNIINDDDSEPHMEEYIIKKKVTESLFVLIIIFLDFKIKEVAPNLKVHFII